MALTVEARRWHSALAERTGFPDRRTGSSRDSSCATRLVLSAVQENLLAGIRECGMRHDQPGRRKPGGALQRGVMRISDRPAGRAVARASRAEPARAVPLDHRPHPGHLGMWMANQRRSSHARAPAAGITPRQQDCRTRVVTGSGHLRCLATPVVGALSTAPAWRRLAASAAAGTGGRSVWRVAALPGAAAEQHTVLQRRPAVVRFSAFQNGSTPA